MIYSVRMRFWVDPSIEPPRRPLHDAMLSVRDIDVEASSYEQAEHFADEIRKALEGAADR